MSNPSHPSKQARAVLLTFLLGLLILGHAAAQDEPQIFKSPDGKVVVTIETGEHLGYSVTLDGQKAVELSSLGVIVDGEDLGQKALFADRPRPKEVDEKYPTRGVHSEAVDHYQAVAIPLLGGKNKLPWNLELRVYNDGVAYRYNVPLSAGHSIKGESTEWKLPANSTIWYLKADNKSYEDHIHTCQVGELAVNSEIMAPMTAKLPSGGYALVTEANLVNYSDMSLRAAENNTFQAFFSNDAKGWTNRGDLISPWRVTILAGDLNTLVNTDIIKNLCPPPDPSFEDATWIRPGRSIWHWLTGGGPKLPEQHTWVDGASALGYEYYLVDDGWKDWNGGGDAAWDALADLVKYAKTKNVNIWAWVHASGVFKPTEREAYYKRAKNIGLAGLKIDFPHAANVEWVNWYEESLKVATKYKLMIDFHGALKPTGRERTWPNEMTREAIAGREQGRNPASHDTALPFLRYIQGHADYTPTLLDPKKLSGSSLAHELAQSIVFTSPYLCMGDNPSFYLQSEAVDVLKALPSVWDQTIVLPPSEIGELAAFARRHGEEWFIGIINGSSATVDVPLTFLPDGEYKIVELADDEKQNDAFVRTEKTVTNKDTLPISMRTDGGFVAWITKAK